MSDTVTIYALADPRSPSVPRYIGACRVPLRRRLSHHISHAKYAKGKKDPWINELLINGLIPVIWPIELCEQENWQERERHWIWFLKPILLNVSIGGKGAAGVPTSEKRRKALSDHAKALNEPRKIKIFCSDLNQEFPSIWEAERILGFASGSIHNAMKRNGKAYGLTFYERTT